MSFKYRRQEFGDLGRPPLQEGASEAATDLLTVRTRSCCGNVLQPQMVEVPDDSGQAFIAQAWRCPTCGRTTF